MSDQHTPIVRLAPAKLNLTLAVVGRRRDGFHDLHSVMVPLALADRLSFAPAAGRDDSLHVAGGASGTSVLDPAGFGTVLQGIKEARRVVGRGATTFPLAVRLEKRIPVGAGLAGGSSDGAAAIDGAIEAWDADVDRNGRLRAAAATGSDVPFFLAGGPALVEGRGEKVTPLAGILGEPPGVLLVTPAVEKSTQRAFHVFDTDPAAVPGFRGSTRLSSEHLAQELGPTYTPMDAQALASRAGVFAVSNDLAKAADIIVPGLRDLRRALTRLLGVPVGLSGSGPTLWALYPSLDGAEEAATKIRSELALGTLDAPGAEPPFVAATTIVSPPRRSA